MIHRENIERYPGTLRELAVELGDLRYDALASFLHAVAQKLAKDATADAARGRRRLATALGDAATGVSAAAAAVERAWIIAEPHMGGPPRD
jgi:hypothetical protein